MFRGEKRCLYVEVKRILSSLRTGVHVALKVDGYLFFTVWFSGYVFYDPLQTGNDVQKILPLQFCFFEAGNLLCAFIPVQGSQGPVFPTDPDTFLQIFHNILIELVPVFVRFEQLTALRGRV